MTRWLVVVPEGDEVKYARQQLLDTDKVIVVDLDALAARLDAPFALAGAASGLFAGIPLYDAAVGAPPTPAATAAVEQCDAPPSATTPAAEKLA